jgi:predicted NBD/HSP70 family sugar kinase
LVDRQGIVLAQAATTRGQSVAGIALGVPGHVDPATGVVSGAVNLRWEHAHPGRLLRERVGLPSRVDNDVNFAALGEAARGVGSTMRDFAVLALGTGVGGALVLVGRLRRGANHAAGELGFLLPSLEQLLHGARMGMEAVFAAHRRRDPLAGRVVEEVVDHVAMVVIDVCAVLDLEGVVVDGSIGRALAPEMPGISERVNATLPYPVQLSVSVLEPSAALVGASVCALEILDEVHP